MATKAKDKLVKDKVTMTFELMGDRKLTKSEKRLFESTIKFMVLQVNNDIRTMAASLNETIIKRAR